ncbi:porin [Photobacterium japonica]|uniref:porin n=1 Tax=Photobacterium japonica TaxID=2910235 RepID=UPI003D0DA297
MAKFPFLPLSLLVIPYSGMAAISITDNLSISGFGSTSITQSDNSVPIFVHREINDDTCYDCDTTFGLQADLALSDAFNASVQVIKRPQDEWSDPELEWAYLSYEYDSLTFQGGRLRIPLFLVSQYYYVGQAYPWARPPQSVYDSLLGVTFYDGLSATWQFELNDELVMSASPFYGFGRNNDIKVGARKITVDADYLAGLSAELNGFDYRLHFSYLRTEYTMTTDVNPAEETLNIYTLGAEYLFNNWQFMAEVHTDNIQSNWYVSAAYTWDKFTPYAVYEESHQRRKTRGATLGVRYDVTPTISLNGEWQGVYMRSADYDQFDIGQFIAPPKVSGEDKDANVYTLMLNFIF